MMNRFHNVLSAAALASLVAACSSGQQSGASSPALPTVAKAAIFQVPTPYVRACATLQAGEDVLCDVLVRTDTGNTDVSPAALTGLTPANLRQAYAIPSGGGNGRTIGIVDAQEDPYAESDLAQYRRYFHIPPCTTKNGCFRKINQKGVTGNYPAANTGWAKEISLDLDMASTVCPKCHILLVEGTSASFKDLGEAVDMAVASGANVVSNSYGGAEFRPADKHYDHPGVTIVASSGDGGFATGPQQPASFATVVAVGGTTLTKTGGGRGYTETAWSGGGAGCSQMVKKPAWQHDTGCANRTLVDVSAVADPATGVAIFDSFGTGGKWLVVGGTSVSTPIVASLFALAGNASTRPAQNLWVGAGAGLFDSITGNDGACSPTYLCNAGTGYDAPTGWGTPNGLAAF